MIRMKNDKNGFPVTVPICRYGLMSFDGESKVIFSDSALGTSLA